MIFEILLSITIILNLFYIFLTWNFNYWKKRGIIGPKPKVLFGNTPNVILQKRSVLLDIQEIYNQYKGIDKFVGIFLLRKPELLLIDPDIIHDVLVTKFKNFSTNDSINVDPKVDPILSKNPFCLTGTEWKEKRSEVTPALTVSRIKASHSIMLFVAKNMTKYIENENKILSSKNSGINGKDLASRYTMEIVANCIYGFEAGTFKNHEKCEMMEMGGGLLEQTFFEQIYFYAVNAFPYILKIYSRPFLSKRSEKYFIGLMEYAIKLRKENQINRLDFLNYLLQLQEKKNLSTLDMAAHTLTFFFDGFETSSVLISNCLYLLAQNQNIQDHLRNEINSALLNCENHDDIFELINDLSYLDNVINETLRLMSPGTILKKLCTESCEFINSKGKVIKIYKGDTVIIPVLSIHLDEEFYENPKEFIPERFNEENGGIKKYKDMNVYLPFSDGPRICLGQRFALAQSKTAIFELIRNWRVTLNSKTAKTFEPEPSTILYLPKGGIWLNFEKIIQ